MNQLLNKSQKPYHAIYTWQMTEVSNPRSDNRGNHADLWPLKILAIARSNGSTLLKIRPDNSTWSAPHKHNWRNKRVKLPNRERQMYQCQKPEWRNGGMAESRNGGKWHQIPKDGIAEWRKIISNPKRWNRGMAEWRKIPRNTKRGYEGKS